MANTAVTTEDGGVINITYTGTGADWYLENDLPQYADAGLKINTIQFIPSAANDICRIRNEDAAGADIYYKKATADTDMPVVPFYGTWKKPYITISEQTFGTPTSVKIIITII